MCYLKKIILPVLIFNFHISIEFKLNAQSYFFGTAPIKWDLRKTYSTPPEALKYKDFDLVILSDLVEFQFYACSKEKIIRNIKYKINTLKGLNQIKKYALPESFDYAFDSELNQAGRRAKIKIPRVHDFKINVFAARKYSNEKWSNVSVKDRYETYRWVKSTGEFSDEENLVFHLGTLAIGDIVELYYEVEFNSRYSSNLFYLNAPYPKLKCDYHFIYRLNKSAGNESYILPINIDSVTITTTKISYDDYFLITKKVSLINLNAIIFPLNNALASSLPHVFADFNYYRSLVKCTDNQFVFSKSSRPQNFQWHVINDTNTKIIRSKIYDKQTVTLQKFISKLPTVGDENLNETFTKTLCDTLNTYRYLNPNNLYYNESNLFGLSSADHLLKQRFSGENVLKTYTDILKENKMFYYSINLIDKRLGTHHQKYRVHHAYEHEILGLPSNGKTLMFLPRYEGIKYHFTELPFYFEDAVAAIFPMNFQADTREKNKKLFRFEQTRNSSFNDNVRVEESTINIRLDSLKASLKTELALSGQFSTILRHFYLNDPCDSTIPKFYFRKCTDKPKAKLSKENLTHKSATFPFTTEFNCITYISLKDTFQFSLKDWFSFTFQKNELAKHSDLDYHFDFEQTDRYIFNLNFSREKNIKNLESFNNALENEFFTLNSSLVKLSNYSYKMEVLLKIKVKMLPKEKLHLLIDLVNELDRLNNFCLEF